jgi:hypothetical protein
VDTAVAVCLPGVGFDQFFRAAHTLLLLCCSLLVDPTCQPGDGMAAFFRWQTLLQARTLVVLLHKGVPRAGTVDAAESLVAAPNELPTDAAVATPEEAAGPTAAPAAAGTAAGSVAGAGAPGGAAAPECEAETLEAPPASKSTDAHVEKDDDEDDLDDIELSDDDGAGAARGSEVDEDWGSWE